MRIGSLRHTLPYLFFTLVFLFSTLLLGFARTCDTPLSKQTNAKSSYTPVLILDAGHGGEDGGAIGADGTVEKHLNLDIASNLSQMLRLGGNQVIMTRTEDRLLYDPNEDYQGRKKQLDLLTRRRIAEQTKNSVFISIHMNAFPQTRYHGLQVYYSKNHQNSEILAKSMQQSVITHLQPDNHRRAKAASSSIYLLTHLTCPAVLVECGFLSNPDECAALGNASYRQKLTLSLYWGIMEFLTLQQEASALSSLTPSSFVLVPHRQLSLAVLPFWENPRLPFPRQA